MNDVLLQFFFNEIIGIVKKNLQNSNLLTDYLNNCAAKNSHKAVHFNSIISANIRSFLISVQNDLKTQMR